MARPSPPAPGLRRTAIAVLVTAGALVIPAAAAAASPATDAAAAASAAAQPTACTPKQSEWATTSTTTPVSVKGLRAGQYKIQAKGSIGGYTTRAIESVTVFLDGEFAGSASLSKAQKFSFTVAAQPRSWSIDVPVTAGAHELLVCSNSSYGSLAGHVTVVQVPAVVLASGPSSESSPPS